MLKHVVMELLTQHFTAVQLEALTRFHESSQGQAILRKHLQARQTEKPPEDASDLPGARTEAARRFMTTFQMERFFGGMTRRQMPRSEDSPESVSKWIHAWYEQVFAPLEFEREVHVDTRRELDALTEFFRSGDGRTIAARAGPFVGDLMKMLDALGK
jgi:hypothetical protein